MEINLSFPNDAECKTCHSLVTDSETSIMLIGLSKSIILVFCSLKCFAEYMTKTMNNVNLDKKLHNIDLLKSMGYTQ